MKSQNTGYAPRPQKETSNCPCPTQKEQLLNRLKTAFLLLDGDDQARIINKSQEPTSNKST